MKGQEGNGTEEGTGKEEVKAEDTEFKKELLLDYKNKTPLFINGYGLGKIIGMGKDFVEFEVIENKEETKKVEGKDKKEKYLTKEVMKFQINKIEIVSTGEQRLEKTTKEKKLDDDLGGL